jgi:hypothetical protein
LIIKGTKEWTYWKEGDKWKKHDKDGNEYDVTDEERKWLDEMIKEAEKKWEEEYGDKSGENEKGGEGEGSSGRESGGAEGENAPSQPNQPY